MKRKLLSIFLIFIGINTFAQNSGKGFNYQAIARDATGNIRKSELINLRFSLLIGSVTGTADWIETHNVNTDAFGAFAVIIGKGNRIGGQLNAFTQLDFHLREYWLKIEIKQDSTASSWLEISDQQLLSVPYAEFASKSVAADNGVPIGSIMPFAGTVLPDGWLWCDGSLLPKVDYPILFNTILTAWGTASDTSKFYLPDFRGLFLRGTDNMDNIVGSGGGNANRDPNSSTRTVLITGGNSGISVGSYQNDEFRDHTHTFTGGDDISTNTHANRFKGSTDSKFMGNTVSSGGSETRPKNIYVNYIIKAK